MPPVNDDFANRIVLVGNSPTDVNDMTDSTNEIGEPQSFETNTMWYEWVSDGEYTTTISMAGSAFTNRIRVYQGDDFSEMSFQLAMGANSVSFPARPGGNYKIQICANSNNLGSTNLALSVVPVTRPPNDDFANRILLSGSDFNVSGDNTNASIESGETNLYDFYGAGINSVWYEWIAPDDGFLTIDTLQSVGISDTILWVFTGDSISNLVLIDFNDDENQSPFSSLSLLTIPVIKNQSYKIAITGSSNLNEGSFVLNGSGPVPPIPPPVAINDMFANAKTLKGASFSDSQNNGSCTTEIGEPTAHYKSVWYKYVPNRNGLLSLSSFSSEVSANIFLYQGKQLISLNLIGQGSSLNSIVYEDLTYYIAVCGQSSLNAGIVQIDGTFVSYPLPANDNFSQRILISDKNFSISANNTMATMQLFESPTNYRSLWYEYQAQENGHITIAQTSGINIKIVVYRGSAINNLVQYASGNNTVSFSLLAGQSYKISICSQSSTSFGAFSFSGTFSDRFLIIRTQYSLPTPAGSPFLNFYQRANALLPGFGANKAMVKESSGRIWAVGDSGGISHPSSPTNRFYLFYSDDNGRNFIADINSKVEYDNYWDTAAKISVFGFHLFLDSQENLIIFFGTAQGPGLNHYFVVRKRLKSNGTWSEVKDNTHTNLSWDNADNNGNHPQIGFNVCQDENNKDLFHVAAFFLQEQIWYRSYTAGALSASWEPLTTYLGVSGTVPDCKIVSINNQLLIYWIEVLTNVSFVYAQKQSNLNSHSTIIKSTATIGGSYGFLDFSFINGKIYCLFEWGSLDVSGEVDYFRMIDSTITLLGSSKDNVQPGSFDVFSAQLYSNGDYFTYQTNHPGHLDGYQIQRYIDGTGDEVAEPIVDIPTLLFNYPADTSVEDFYAIVASFISYNIPEPEEFPEACGEIGQILANNFGPITPVLNAPTIPAEKCATATKLKSSYP